MKPADLRLIYQKGYETKVPNTKINTLHNFLLQLHNSHLRDDPIMSVDARSVEIIKMGSST